MKLDSLSQEAGARGGFRYAPRALLVILRVHLGVILLVTDMGKLTSAAPFSVEMLGFIQGYAMRNASAPYRQFLAQSVVPHATLFSYLVMAGELVAGLSLLTGTATRVGAAVAMFLFLNFMLAKGRLFWSPDSEDAAVFFSALVVMLGAAGRVWGVDARLARRWPSLPLW
ncbi:MAG TPA: DoxX family protein [Pyrinomonadaceae bacterium]|nr:DoxX family protein [Pyrinomonadaceae bacterium]